MKKISKLLSVFLCLLLFAGNVAFGVSVSNPSGGSVSAPNYFKKVGSGLLPVVATYTLGSAATSWLAGYFTTLYVGGITMSGDLDMANNLILNIGAAGTDFTSGGGLNITTDLDVVDSATVGDFTIDEATGVLNFSGATSASILSDSDALTMGGVNGAANNENLIFNFEAVADTIGLSSTTGATNFDLGSFDLSVNSVTTNALNLLGAFTITATDANALLVEDAGGTDYFNFNTDTPQATFTAPLQIDTSSYTALNMSGVLGGGQLVQFDSTNNYLRFGHEPSGVTGFYVSLTYLNDGANDYADRMVMSDSLVGDGETIAAASTQTLTANGTSGFDWATVQITGGAHTGENWTLLLRTDVFVNSAAISTWLDQHTEVGAGNYTITNEFMAAPDNVTAQGSLQAYDWNLCGVCSYVGTSDPTTYGYLDYAPNGDNGTLSHSTFFTDNLGLKYFDIFDNAIFNNMDVEFRNSEIQLHYGYGYGYDWEQWGAIRIESTADVVDFESYAEDDEDAHNIAILAGEGGKDNDGTGGNNSGEAWLATFNGSDAKTGSGTNGGDSKNVYIWAGLGGAGDGAGTAGLNGDVVLGFLPTFLGGTAQSYVGIGLPDPTSTLHIAGGMNYNDTPVTGATYNTDNDDYFINIDYTATGVVAVELQTAQCTDGKAFIIVDTGLNASANAITVSTEGAEKISGNDTVDITGDGDSLSVECHDGDWFIF